MTPVLTSQFEDDVQRVKSRGRDLELLKETITKLCKGERLDSPFRPHKLSGDYAGCWEAHLKYDWLLIWRVESEQDEVHFLRTGSHEDLFG